MNPSCRSMSFVGVAYKSSDVGRCVGPVSLALWVMVALMRRVHESRGVRTDSWVCLLKVVDRYVECPRRLHRASHIVTEGHPDDIGRLSDHHAVVVFANSARLGHGSIARRGRSVWAFFFWIPFSPPLDRAQGAVQHSLGLDACIHGAVIHRLPALPGIVIIVDRKATTFIIDGSRSQRWAWLGTFEFCDGFSAARVSQTRRLVTRLSGPSAGGYESSSLVMRLGRFASRSVLR